MILSQTVEYALRAVVLLADQMDQPQTNPQIAEVTQVPPGYLFKVLQSLGRAGLVNSQRGAGGGFTLARAPEEISLLEVINAIDPIQRIKTCPLGIESHGKRLCPLHRKLDDATKHIESLFAETTVADLLKTTGSKPLCRTQELHSLSVKAKKG